MWAAARDRILLDRPPILDGSIPGIQDLRLPNDRPDDVWLVLDGGNGYRFFERLLDALVLGELLYVHKSYSRQKIPAIVGAYDAR